MPSPETIADLKKKCVLAQKKDLSFYYFAKAEGGEPALLMGKASAVRTEQKALAAQHKTKPVAQGSVKKSADGGKLVFELLKGKPAPLQKALKTTFNEVPQLKSADVQAQSKQVSLKDKLSGALKGGDQAFARRAGKLQEAIAGARKILADLLKAGVTPPEGDRIDDIENALEVARDLSETDPKDAYTALAPVKDDILKVTQALSDLSKNLTRHREEAGKHATTADTRLTAAKTGLKELKAAGYDGDEESAAILSAEGDIKAARARIQADPTRAGADLQKIAATLSTLTSSMAKKKGQSRASLGQKIEAGLKANDDTYTRRLAKVKDESRITTALSGQLQSMGILSSADEKTLRAIQEGIRIAEKSSEDSYKNGYAQLAQAKEKIAAFKQEAERRIAQYTPLMVALSDDSARIAAARARLAALVQGGGSLEGAETTLKGLLSALVSTETLATSDPKQAQAVHKKLSAEIDLLHQRLAQAERAGRSPEENTFRDRVQEVRQHLEGCTAEEDKLYHLCAQHLYSEELKAIASLIDKSEALSSTSAKSATSTLKQARTYAQALLPQIQQKVRDYPKRLQALQARIAQLKADLDHAERQIAAIGEARKLTQEKATLTALLSALQDASALIQTDPAKGHDALATPVKTARQLCTTLDQILAEDALRIDSAARGQEPPKSSSPYDKHIALLRIQLRSTETLASKINLQASDRDTFFKGIQERLEAVPAMLRSAPLQGVEDLAEVKDQIQKVIALVEGHQQGLSRITQHLSTRTLQTLLSHKPLWERFLSYAAQEFSAENIPMWQGILEKRFKSPKTKKMAYLQFLTPQSPGQINASNKEIEACFPNSQRPTQGQMDDWDFWAQVDYDGLQGPLEINLSDTYSRFIFHLTDPIQAELAKSPMRDGPKIIAKWEARLG